MLNTNKKVNRYVPVNKVPAEYITFPDHKWIHSISYECFQNEDYNVYFAVLKKMCEQNSTDVVMTFDEIRNFINCDNLEGEDFYRALYAKTGRTMSAHGVMLSDDGYDCLQYAIFIGFQYDFNEKYISARLNRDFFFVIKRLMDCFSVADLTKFVLLNSQYSKALFRIMREYKSEGKHTFTAKEFCNQLGIGKSHLNDKIYDTIIKPSVLELQKLNCVSEMNFSIQYNPKKPNTIESFTLDWVDNDKSQIVTDERAKKCIRLMDTWKYMKLSDEDYYKIFTLWNTYIDVSSVKPVIQKMPA